MWLLACQVTSTGNPSVACWGLTPQAALDEGINKIKETHRRQNVDDGGESHQYIRVKLELQPGTLAEIQVFICYSIIF